MSRIRDIRRAGAPVFIRNSMALTDGNKFVTELARV
jgi:hypothetical protein